MASIERREGKNGISYRITVSLGRGDDGRQILKKTTFRPTKRTEKAILKELNTFVVNFEQAAQAGELYDGEKLTFKAVMDMWCDNWSGEHLTESVKEGYVDILERRVLPCIGDYKISKITAPMIEKILSDMRKNGKAIKTIQRTFTCINSVFKYAYRTRLIKENPCSRVELPSLKTERMQKNIQPEIRCFDLEQSKRFLESLSWKYPIEFGKRKRYDANGTAYEVKEYTSVLTLPLQWQVFFTLAIYGGFRRGELVPLRWSDIDFNNNTITIRRAVAKTKKRQVEKSPKTWAGYRTIELPKDCFIILRRLQFEQAVDKEASTGNMIVMKEAGNDYVFRQENGEMMNVDSPTWAFKKHLKRYNALITKRIKDGKAMSAELLPEITLHDLRHSAASLLIASGVDPVTVANRLGHADVRTTLNVYSHAMKQADKTASDTLQRLFG